MTSLRRRLATASEWLVGPRLREALLSTWTGWSSAGEPGFEALRESVGDRRRCFVIGNGPSLKGTDLRPLAGEFTIGANSFYKHPHAKAIGLDILCVFDPHFMSDQPRSVAWHQTIAQELPATQFVLHESARTLIARHNLYAGRNVLYARSGSPTRISKLVNIDFRLPRNIGMTTGSSVAIPLAIYLGFKEICLIGFDCNWMESSGSSYHFYETHEYFPEFDSVSKDIRGYSYEDELRSTLREFESHRLLRQRAESMGVRIVNATDGGLLDSYPRMSLEQYLADGGA